MKWKKILYIISFFVVLSCKKSDNQSIKSWEVISENVQYSEQNDKFLLKSRKFEYSFEKKELPFSKVVLLNNSLLGYFLELRQEEKIVGISGVQYVYSNEIQQLVEKNKIQNVGSDQKYDIEKILELKPDVIFTNYIETFENTYKILQDNGIKIIFLDEYLEETPLDKVAYIKLFGKLLGEEKRAEEIYTKIKKDYESIKQKAQKSPNKPKVLANEMYGNHWYIAGGKTFSANYLKDAGADYIFKENQEKKCENGYFLNLETNRCNKILVEKATLECHEGYERNLETNRCRKISSAIVSKKDVLCATGYTRNPETNRCRKNSNETKKELAPCKDGYERNEETNRCRKVVKNSGASDDVEKDEEKSKQAKFTGWWIIAVVILVFLAILFFEFRKDIFAKFSKGKK